ncbi:MAG: hypothetical protein KAU20_06465 [Nanoarchaeota archaeon]|nr:hypothetical protein [Nanoarchaeota archaeon]
MTTQKRNYCLDERTFSQMKHTMQMAQKRALEFLKKFTKGHSEPIEIIKITYLGSEWDPEYLENLSIEDCDTVTQEADVMLKYKDMDGNIKEKYMEIKSWNNGGNYTHCSIIKEGQANTFHRQNKEVMYAVYDWVNDKYSILSLEDALTYPVISSKFVGRKLAFNIPVSEMNFKSFK